MTEERWFPIQGEHGSERDAGGDILEHWKRPRGQVPWSVAVRAYQVYARMYGKGQSLETLAARGGFSWSELVWLIAGGPDEFDTLRIARPATAFPGRSDE